MNLNNTFRDLERLREKEDFFAEDVLACLYDLCTDIEAETGSSVDKKEVHNVSKLMERLPWLGQLSVRIYRRNQASIEAAGKGGRMEKVTARISETEDRLRASAAVLRAEQQKLEELEELEQELKEQKSQEEALKQKRTELETSIKSLRGVRLDEVRDEIAELERQQEQAQRELNQQKAELEKQQAQASQMTEASNRLTRQLEQAKETCRTGTAEQARLAGQLADQELENAGRAKEIASAKNRLAEQRSLYQRYTEQELPAVQTALTEAEVQAENAHTQLECLRGSLAERTAEAEQLNAVCEELEGRLAAEQKACQTSGAEQQRLTEELRAKEAENNRLREQLTGLQQSLRQQETLCQDYTEQQLPAVQAALTEAGAQAESARAEVERRRASLIERQTEAEQLKAAAAELSSRLAELMEECGANSEEQKSLAKQLAARTAENAACREQIDNARQELVEQQALYQDYTEQQLPALRAALEELRLELKKAREERAMLETRQAQDSQTERQLLEENQTLRKELVEQENQSTVLAQEKERNVLLRDERKQLISQLNGECAALQKELAQLDETLASRDFDQLKRQLSEALTENQRQLALYEELKNRLKKEREALEKNRMHNQSEQEEIEEQLEKGKEEVRCHQQRLLELEQAKDALEQTKKENQQRAASLTRKIQEYQTWLKDTKAGWNAEKLAVLANRVQQLRNLKNSLERDWNALSARHQGDEAEVSYKRWLNNEFRSLEEKINKYQEQYRSIIRSLDSGGN